MMTEGGVELMTTEGRVEVQLERKARQDREGVNGPAPTFICPAAQGRGEPRSDASSPESGALIGPSPSLASMAGSSKIALPAR